jgi:hypothetical protein
VSLKKVIDWMSHAGGTSPKEIAMKARVREGDPTANHRTVAGLVVLDLESQELVNGIESRLVVRRDL